MQGLKPQSVSESQAIVCLLYTNIFQLDSLKWYKDGQEFFRVVTGPVSQEANEFAAHGVNIDQDQVRFHPSIHLVVT